MIGKLPRPEKGFVLPSHKYTGPYNPLEKQIDSNNRPRKGEEPFNGVDNISMHHDICYRDGYPKIECDQKMKAELNDLKPKNLRENFDKKLVSGIMNLKMLLDGNFSLQGGGIKNMIDKDYFKLITSTGMTFDKKLIDQNFQLNYLNTLNLFNTLPTIHKAYDQLTDGYQTPTKFSSPYINSLIDLGISKKDINIISSFQSQENTTHHFTNTLSKLAVCLNNPYLLTEQQTEPMQHEENSYEDDSNKNGFLLILNDLRHPSLPII